MQWRISLTGCALLALGLAAGCQNSNPYSQPHPPQYQTYPQQVHPQTIQPQQHPHQFESQGSPMAPGGQVQPGDPGGF